MNYHKKIGNMYENLACQILEKNNYKILDRNYTGEHGEIDIVASFQNTIVFVEVKYRKNLQFGDSFDAITKTKLRRMYLTANEYIYENNLFDEIIRFDCICFLAENFSWQKNILWGDEIGF